MIQENTNREEPKSRLELFELYLWSFQKEIYCYISSLTHAHEDAEDLTQETFFKFYKNMDRLDTQKNPRALLYAIARTTTYDWFRAKKKKPVPFSDSKNEYDFDIIDARLPIGTKNLILDIERAFGEIKPLYARALKLFYLEGYSYLEIALELTLPLNTVKTYMMRGKIALKGHLV